MRLLSFCNQVELTLAMLRPEAASGWQRRADYQTGSATSWHPRLGLALVLRACALSEDRFSIVAAWHGPSGQELFSRTFFCGASVYDWQSAADAVAEAMPEPLLFAEGESAAASSSSPIDSDAIDALLAGVARS